MKQDEIKICIDKIKSYASGLVGTNPSLFAHVDRQEYFGVRTVEITIIHEARAASDDAMRRIRDVMAKVSESLINLLGSEGYSVTEPENLNSYIGPDNRARMMIRTSLKPVNVAEPVPASTENLGAPALTPEEGPAIKWD